MKILVTGAGGNANQVLIPQLIEAGHEVLAYDINAVDYDCESVRASVLDELALCKYMKGKDLIIHAAGCTSHSHPRTPKKPEAYEDWWVMTTLSTHHLYKAALFAETPRKVIFLSSQCYYATDRGPGVIDEEYPAARPADHYYNLGKVLSEEIAIYYAGHHDIQTIALRPGNFTGLPDPNPEFLETRLRREDVAQMMFKCVDYEPEEGFEAFNAFAGVPFKPEDLDDMQNKPMKLIDRYWPGAKELMEKNGDSWGGTDRLNMIQKAKDKLRYEPQFTFETYLESLGWKK